MQWIFLSPHFDDAVFSCGGLIWEETAEGDRVEIWTICAGDVPVGELSEFAQIHHERWETGPNAVAHRRQEDQHACARVGAGYRYFPLPDCIYRRAGENYLDGSVAEAPTGSPLGEHLYKSDEELFGPLHSAEDPLVGQLSALLSASTPKNAAIVCPLAVGGHADHRLTRAAAEASGKRLKYYIDFPYILRDFGPIEELNEQAWQSRLFQVTQAGFEAWYEAIAAHQSQISTFWEDLPQMRAELEAYHAKFGGIRLWEPPFQENPHRGPGDK